MACRLFIADDSMLLCAHLVEMLSKLDGIKIVGVSHNALDAINVVNREKPDLAILDIMMPGGSGLDILKSINENGLATKVIVFTNFAYPQYRKAYMDEGADYFFDKYKEFEDMTKVVRKISRVMNKTALEG